MIGQLLNHMKPQIVSGASAAMAWITEATEMARTDLLEQYPFEWIDLTNGGLIVISGVTMAFASAVVGIYGFFKSPVRRSK